MTPPTSDPAAPRFLADANFNLRIVAGLRRRLPLVDVVTARDLNLRTTPDPEVLRQAKVYDRILLTRDVHTMPGHLDELLASLSAEEYSPGIFAIPQLLPIGSAIDALQLICECSRHEEWRNRFIYLPL